MKNIKPTTDGKPLFSNVHKKQPGWGTNISYNDRHLVWLENFVDYLVVRFTRAKLTESNLESYDTNDKPTT